MGEWKRVFGGRRRMCSLAFLALLCAGLFFGSQPDFVRPGELERVTACSQYTASLIERWRGYALVELPELVEEEQARRNAFDDWYYFYYWGYEPSNELSFDNEEEAFASISDLPLLIQSVQETQRTYAVNNIALWESLTQLETEVDYLLGYPDYLNNVQVQAEQQSKSSIFSVADSFSQRNLQKTAKDFSTLCGVEVSFGNGRGIEKWLEFELGDYFHLIGILLFVMAFLEERKKGLWSVVRACRGGRIQMGLHRLGILAAASVLCTALFCGIPLAVSLGFYGGWQDLDRSLQSIESFKTCTVQTTVGSWLLQYFLVKLVGGILIGLLLWCLLGSIANIQFSLSVLGAVLIGEYVFYEFLPVQSALNVIKYFNIFAYVHTSVLYTNYLNIDLFGFPVGIRALLLISLPGLSLLLAVWAVCIQHFRYPEGNRDVLSRLALRWNRLLDSLRARLTIGGWEAYKTLFLEYGVLLLLIVFLASRSLGYIVALPTQTDQWYDKYMADLQGPIDDTTDDYFTVARKYADTAIDAPVLHNALNQLEQRVNNLRSSAAEGGYEPWLVDPSSYDAVYGDGSQFVQRFNAAMAVVFLTLCCAGIGAYERQSGMVCILRSLKQGRNRLFVRKVVSAALMSVFVWAVVYLRELNAFLDYFHVPDSLAAPVQSLDALAAFPIVITFQQYLALLYVARLIMLVAESWIILLLSQLSPNLQIAYLLSVGTLGIPALLLTFGVEELKWICPVVPISSAELLWGIGSGNLIYLLPWLVWLLITLAALIIYRKMWVR